MASPEVFDRSATVRRSKARKALREKTALADEQIEGWKIMFDRNVSVRLSHFGAFSHAFVVVAIVISAEERRHPHAARTGETRKPPCRGLATDDALQGTGYEPEKRTRRRERSRPRRRRAIRAQPAPARERQEDGQARLSCGPASQPPILCCTAVLYDGSSMTSSVRRLFLTRRRTAKDATTKAKSERAAVKAKAAA